MMSVFWWEISRRKAFTFWWTLGVSFLIGLTVLAYNSFDGDAQQLDEVFSGLTESAGAFFGGTDFFSPVGYLSSQIYFILLPLLIIIASVTLVSSLVKADEDDTTVELTLARPISRRQLLFAKAMSGLFIMAIIATVSYIVAAISVDIVDLDINGSYLVMTHMLSFAFSISFAAIGFMLITMSKATRRLSMIAVMLLSFGGYTIVSLAGFWSQLENIAKLMPYYYYDTAELLRGTVDTGLIIYLVTVFAVVAIVSAFGYSRRDIG